MSAATTLAQQLETRIRRELPSLSIEQSVELADLVRQLIDQFQPECIYASVRELEEVLSLTAMSISWSLSRNRTIPDIDGPRTRAGYTA
jgi:hypothetical protein